jgi:UDP-2-acetamido-2,6-beta-L-arabino-hexul-4-ose reductase
MKQVLVTGARGFVGRNLCAMLRRHEDLKLVELDIEDPLPEIVPALGRADCIFHLAGVNRPKNIEEFETGNAELLEQLCRMLRELRRSPKVVLTSSIQAEMDNPYGRSKRHAEEILKAFAEESGASCVVYRLKNLFGKWCRPNYNSVTATFCNNIANGLPIQISDRGKEIELTHIDDVVAAFLEELNVISTGFRFADPLPSTNISLGELADKLIYYKKMRDTLLLPNFGDAFERALYGTYLSYLDKEDFAYCLDIKTDQRGSLAEFIKAPCMGQIFVSRTKPGVTRGDHFHHTKAEKFLVMQGKANIRFRHIESNQVQEYIVGGEEYRVLDIPPGYTHSIQNIGDDDLVTLFWAGEVYNPGRPDTYFEKVK